jgi:hypothetical protein
MCRMNWLVVVAMLLPPLALEQRTCANGIRIEGTITDSTGGRPTGLPMVRRAYSCRQRDRLTSTCNLVRKDMR